MKPVILERRTQYSGYLTVERLRIRLRDGAEIWREVERHGNAAAVLPYAPARRCALIVQLFRAPVFDVRGAPSLQEACAGMVVGEEPAAAARREALEELGVTPHRLDCVARIWSSPGVCTEQVSLFLAHYGDTDRTAKGGGIASEHEEITVVERSLRALATDLDQGQVEDAKLAILLLTLRSRKPELFA
jgi:nudix-type nucleoside diphosphatase (YffH/AdpP family)